MKPKQDDFCTEQRVTRKGHTPSKINGSVPGWRDTKIYRKRKSTFSLLLHVKNFIFTLYFNKRIWTLYQKLNKCHLSLGLNFKFPSTINKVALNTWSQLWTQRICSLQHKFNIGSPRKSRTEGSDSPGSPKSIGTLAGEWWWCSRGPFYWGLLPHPGEVKLPKVAWFSHFPSKMQIHP